MADIVDPKDVLDAFCEKPLTCKVLPLGQGNINDTFLVESKDSPFVLQKISSAVFPEPLRVVQNFQVISSHLAAKVEGVAQPFRFASPVVTRQGELFYQDNNGDFWRAQTYVPHTNLKTISSRNHAHQVGLVLAAFHHFVADLDVLKLQDPLPGFHDLRGYLEEFDRELALRPPDLDGDTRYCLERIERYRGQVSIFEKAKNAGLVNLQPVHGDPKIDNFLFDDRGKAFGMLDLDTVGAGLVHLDLGDCLRSCCNRAGETGTDPVAFDMDLCKALLKGYFSWPYSRFSGEQSILIYDAVFLVSFELAVRFFTDHLHGNVYFKVVQDGDNLKRAVRQFKLTDDIEYRQQDIRAIATTKIMVS